MQRVPLMQHFVANHPINASMHSSLYNSQRAGRTGRENRQPPGRTAACLKPRLHGLLDHADAHGVGVTALGAVGDDGASERNGLSVSAAWEQVVRELGKETERISVRSKL